MGQRSGDRHIVDEDDDAIFNMMLPRGYSPEWQGNVFARVGRTIAEQLCGEGMTLDFDQLLAKQPGREDAVFAWHQDQAYWINTDDQAVPNRVDGLLAD